MTGSVVMKCDSTSLNVTRSGVVWGDVWLDVGAGGFPEIGWNDMLVPVMICAAQATAALRGVGDTGSFTFFDGPFDVKLAVVEDDVITVDMRRVGRTLVQGRATRDPWVSGLIDCGAAVVVECATREWSGLSSVRDLDKALRSLSS
jgi:hypothetical protein